MTAKCEYAGCGKTTADRHGHDYEPPIDGQRVCRCGSRKWTLTAGGMLPPTVACTRNGHRSKINTAYERGRDDPREAASDVPATAPF